MRVFLLLVLGLVWVVETPAQALSLVSSNDVIPVVVFQEDCPLRVEAFFALKDVSGRISLEYSVRNIGIKPIKSYRIARWYSDNSGFREYGIMPPERLLKIGNSVSTVTGSYKSAIAASTKSTEKRIAFFLILEITFDDGTKFSQPEVFESLENHLKSFEIYYDTSQSKNK